MMKRPKMTEITVIPNARILRPCVDVRLSSKTYSSSPGGVLLVRVGCVRAAFRGVVSLAETMISRLPCKGKTPHACLFRERCMR
jgi:hypothetical protein